MLFAAVGSKTDRSGAVHPIHRRLTYVDSVYTGTVQVIAFANFSGEQLIMKRGFMIAIRTSIDIDRRLALDVQERKKNATC